MLEALEKDPRLLYAEPNSISEAPEVSRHDTWAWGGEDPTLMFEQYAVEMLNLGEAHTLSRGAGVVVAVLDTGVQLDHPALAASLTATGYDFVEDDPVPEDEFSLLDAGTADGVQHDVVGHGTHVAGIVHLVAPEAHIMPLRVLDAHGHGTIFDVAQALLYATRHGAEVINLSLGTPYPSDLLAEVIDEVIAAGIVVVAAAGNGNTDVPHYPATLDKVVAVTAVGSEAQKADFANFGSWVGLAAPGVRIYSPFPLNGYAWWSGTSMATPFVTGQAALIRSVAPALTPEAIAQRIYASAHSLDETNPTYAGLLGAGFPDIVASLGLVYDFVVAGQEGVWLQQGVTVMSGDIGTNLVSAGPFIDAEAEVSLDKNVHLVDPSSRVLGDSVSVAPGAHVYDVFYNDLRGDGTILGTQSTPLALPLATRFPSVPGFTPGTQNLDWPKTGADTVDAGSYGTLKVEPGATVTFTGGIYNFEAWEVGQQVTLHFRAPAEIRIAGRLAIAQGGYLGPDPSASELGAPDIVIFVTGQNGHTGHLEATPKAVEFGRNTTVIANVFAAHGTLWLHQGTEAMGAFLGQWVIVDKSVKLTLDSGF
jgi:subtilisin family serine protease